MTLARWMAAAFLLFLAIVATVRTSPVVLTRDCSAMRLGALVAFSGRVSQFGGRKLLCASCCLRLAGSAAENGSWATVTGIVTGQDEKYGASMAVVDESWSLRN
jgi:hypothetical protein